MSKISEVKSIVVRKEVCSGLRCDCCGKELNDMVHNNSWIEVSAQHDEWGNDSHESLVYYDCCSPQCYFDILEKIVVDFKNYESSTEINDMNYYFLKSLVDYIKKLKTNDGEDMRDE